MQQIRKRLSENNLQRVSGCSQERIDFLKGDCGTENGRKKKREQRAPKN